MWCSQVWRLVVGWGVCVFSLCGLVLVGLGGFLCCVFVGLGGCIYRLCVFVRFGGGMYCVCVFRLIGVVGIWVYMAWCLCLNRI